MIVGQGTFNGVNPITATNLQISIREVKSINCDEFKDPCKMMEGRISRSLSLFLVSPILKELQGIWVKILDDLAGDQTMQMYGGMSPIMVHWLGWCHVMTPVWSIGP